MPLMCPRSLWAALHYGQRCLHHILIIIYCVPIFCWKFEWGSIGDCHNRNIFPAHLGSSIDPVLGDYTLFVKTASWKYRRLFGEGVLSTCLLRQDCLWALCITASLTGMVFNVWKSSHSDRRCVILYQVFLIVPPSSSSYQTNYRSIQ